MKHFRIAAALLLVFCFLSFAGCDTLPQVADGGTDTDDLVCIARDCVVLGNRFSDLMMDETAAYFYGFAGTVVGSLRLTVERVLWLKGEGEDFASLSEGSRYTDWDRIAELCCASPYPYYFEGLLYDFQGKTDEAAEAYTYASNMTNYPAEGLDLWYLKDMSVGDLYALRDELRKEEDKIYEVYTPVFYGYERSFYASFAEYLYADAAELFEAGRYPESVIPARYAVRINPKNEDHWTQAVASALYADDPHQAAAWLEEGLKYFPNSEKLDAFYKALTDLSESSDNGGDIGGE